MKKLLLLIGIALAFSVLCLYVFNVFSAQENQVEQVIVPPSPHYKNATYTIDGQNFTLINGVVQTQSAPDSVSKTTTRYFGNEVNVDLNKDGRQDVAFILTQELGGSGTFYYLVGALNTEDGYLGTSGFFLGDRISPQTTEVVSEHIVLVNYADRMPEESFATMPSVGKSVWLSFDDTSRQFNDVSFNFGGVMTASTSLPVVSLQSKVWTWKETVYTDETTLVPKQSDAFTLDMQKEGLVSITTDCNNGGGTYTSGDGALTFGEIITTKMFCEGSAEQEFMSLLVETEGYAISDDGELELTLKDGSGTVYFK